MHQDVEGLGINPGDGRKNQPRHQHKTTGADSAAALPPEPMLWPTHSQGVADGLLWVAPSPDDDHAAVGIQRGVARRRLRWPGIVFYTLNSANGDAVDVKEALSISPVIHLDVVDVDISVAVGFCSLVRVKRIQRGDSTAAWSARG